MQSELAYMSLGWGRRNDSCGRIQGVPLSASLSSSKYGMKETLHRTDSDTNDTCLTTSRAPSKTSNCNNNHSVVNSTKTLLGLPCELRLRIIEYIVHAEGLPEIQYQKATRSDLARQHALNKTCQQLSHEFNQIQREKAVHVIHHVFGHGDINSTNERFPDATFGDLDHVRRVRVVAELSTSFQQINAIDIITSECSRFHRAKNVCVELRMSASSLPFYGIHAPNTHATELVLILGIQSHLPGVFLPGPAPMEDWLADIIKQFPNVGKVSLTWVGVRWRDGYVKSVEEKLLRDSLEGMCKEGTEIDTSVKQLW